MTTCTGIHCACIYCTRGDCTSILVTIGVGRLWELRGRNSCLPIGYLEYGDMFPHKNVASIDSKRTFSLHITPNMYMYRALNLISASPEKFSYSDWTRNIVEIVSFSGNNKYAILIQTTHPVSVCFVILNIDLLFPSQLQDNLWLQSIEIWKNQGEMVIV